MEKIDRNRSTETGNSLEGYVCDIFIALKRSVNTKIVPVIGQGRRIVSRLNLDQRRWDTKIEFLQNPVELHRK